MLFIASTAAVYVVDMATVYGVRYQLGDCSQQLFAVVRLGPAVVNVAELVCAELVGSLLGSAGLRGFWTWFLLGWLWGALVVSWAWHVLVDRRRGGDGHEYGVDERNMHKKASEHGEKKGGLPLFMRV